MYVCRYRIQNTEVAEISNPAYRSNNPAELEIIIFRNDFLVPIFRRLHGTQNQVMHVVLIAG